MNNTNDIDTNIKKLLKIKDKAKAEELFDKYRSADIAESLNDLESAKDVFTIFSLFNDKEQAELVTYLGVQEQEYIFNHLDNKELSRLVDDIYSDDLVDIIDELPRKIVNRILVNSTPEKRKELNSILKYSEDSAGGIMSVNYLSFKQSVTVKEVVDKIRIVHDNFESIDDIYVVDEFGNLVGQIKLKDLVTNGPSVKLQQIMDTAVIAVDINQDQEEVVQLFKKYDVNTIPVINEARKLTGVITSDDIMDVIEKEQTEDMQKISGIMPLDDDSLFDTSMWKMILSRSIWLVVGILLATITQILLVVFLKPFKVDAAIPENNGSAFSAVYLLTPMVFVIAAVCGISVNQTTTSMIRLLSLKSFDKKELWKVVGKEALVNTVLAVAVVLVNLVRLVIFYQVEDKQLKTDEWYAIASSSIALFIGMEFSGLIGTLLPIGAKKMKLDPALVSAPLTTGIVDIITVAIFYGIGLAF